MMVHREALWKIFLFKDFTQRFAQNFEIEESLLVERDKPSFNKNIIFARLYRFNVYNLFNYVVFNITSKIL